MGWWARPWLYCVVCHQPGPAGLVFEHVYCVNKFELFCAVLLSLLCCVFVRSYRR